MNKNERIKELLVKINDSFFNEGSISLELLDEVYELDKTNVFPEILFFKSTFLSWIQNYEQSNTLAWEANKRWFHNESIKVLNILHESLILLISKNNIYLKKFNEVLRCISHVEKSENFNLVKNEALLYKGHSHKQLGNYNEAILQYYKIIAYPPSEENNNAIINLDMLDCFFSMKKYSEIIQIVNLINNEKINFFQSNYYVYKGKALFELNELEKAIIAYTKAEVVSDDGHNIIASMAKGELYLVKNTLGEAIKSYNKALSANIHSHLEFFYKYDLEIKLYDIDNGIEFIKYSKETPSISSFLNRQIGYCYYLLGYYDTALNYVNLSINDKEDIPFVGAFHLKGIIFEAKRDYEKSIENYSLAENYGLNQKFPYASFSRGKVLIILRNYKEALKALTKAENDKEVGFPEASYEKGMLYKKIEEFELAKISFRKAINDTPEQIYPLSELRLSEIALIENNYYLAKYHGYKAISQNTYIYEIVNNIYINFSQISTGYIYKNRLKYLPLTYQKLLLNFHNDSIKKFHVENFLATIQKRELNNIDSFIELLIDSEINFPESISLADRYRLAYLISYKNRDYGKVFLILELRAKNVNEMKDSMDSFFHLLSAYLIGEPHVKLLDIINIQVLKTHDFDSLDQRNKYFIKNAISNSDYHDEYLLKVESTFATFTLSPNTNLYHDWVYSALKIVNNDDSQYIIPIGNSVINGMVGLKLIENFNVIDQEKHTIKTIWETLMLHLDKLRETSKKYEDIIHIIRNAILEEEIPPSLILIELGSRYVNENNSIKKYNLAILMSATIFSFIVDYKGNSLYRKSSSSILIEGFTSGSLSDLIPKELNYIFELLIGCGLNVSINYIYKLTSLYLNKSEEENKKEFFQRLVDDIQTINY